MPEDCLEVLLSDVEVAKVLRVSLALVRRWRRTPGEGPAWFKVGRCLVRYSPGAVREYVATQAAAQRAA